MQISQEDFAVLTESATLTGAKQNALARILAALLTQPEAGRPFIFSEGELRMAIRLGEELAGTTGVLNYVHPLLPDPAVSCASKQQLLDNLRIRFPEAMLSSLMFDFAVRAGRTDAEAQWEQGRVVRPRSVYFLGDFEKEFPEATQAQTVRALDVYLTYCR